LGERDNLHSKTQWKKKPELKSFDNQLGFQQLHK